jgi:lysozyme family protein
MADFDKALELTLKHEGGYSNDPNDRGGETIFGIARNMNAKWGGWAFVDDKRSQPGFPKTLETDQGLKQAAGVFYKANYWSPVGGDFITSQHIAESMFDFAVNGGTGAAVRLAQVALKLPVNGVADRTLISSINAQDEEAFLALYALAKVARYIDICKKTPTNKKYFYGWISRVMEGL